MGKRGTKRVLEYARLAMGFANVRAGTRVLMLWCWCRPSSGSGEEEYMSTALHASLQHIGGLSDPLYKASWSLRGRPLLISETNILISRRKSVPKTLRKQVSKIF